MLKFKKSGYYRIYVEDTDWNKSYIQFTVWSASEDDSDTTSNVDGFTSRQLEKVKKVYKEWYNVIWQIQRKYPTLKKDNYWIRLSDNFYEDMKDVINNKKYREFYTYEDFLDWFSEWYRYTMQNI